MNTGTPDPVKNADAATDRPRTTDERIGGMILSALARAEELGLRRLRLVLEPRGMDVVFLGSDEHRSGPGPLSGPLLVALKEMAGLATGPLVRRVRGDLLAGSDEVGQRWFRVHIDAAPSGVRAVIERIEGAWPLHATEEEAPEEAEAALDEAVRAGSVEERTAALARAGDLARDAGATALHVEARRAEADVALAFGDDQRASVLLLEAFDALEAAQADPLAKAATLLGLVDAHAADPGRALAYAERAEALVSEGFGEESLDAAHMRWRTGGCLIAAGERERGYAVLLDAIERSERAFDARTASDAYARVRLAGMREASEGSRAVQDAREGALALDQACAGLKSEVWERGHAQRTLGFLLWRTGRAPHAKRAFEKACQIAQRLGRPRDIAAADASDLLAVVLAEAGEFETAERALARATKRAEALSGPQRQARDAFLAFAEGRLHEARGRAEDAAESYTRAAEHPALAVIAAERSSKLA